MNRARAIALSVTVLAVVGVFVTLRVATAAVLRSPLQAPDRARGSKPVPSRSPSASPDDRFLGEPCSKVRGAGSCR